MHHIVFKNVSLPSVVYTITILLRCRRRVSAHDDNSPFSFRTRTDADPKNNIQVWRNFKRCDRLSELE